MVNPDLRELISLAAALGTVEQDGWQTVTSNKVPPQAVAQVATSPNIYA